MSVDFQARALRKPPPASRCLSNSAKIAEDIGIAALKLATRAHDAGLTTIAYLLQSVALEAGAEAATRWWSDDVAER